MAFKSPQTEHFPLILGRKELLGWQFRKKGADFADVLVGKGRGRRAASPCPLPVPGLSALPLRHFPPFPPVSSCPAPLPPQPSAPTRALPAASQQSWVKEKKQNTNRPLLSQCRPGWRRLPDSHHPRQPLLQLLRALYHVHPGGIPPGRAPRRGAGAACGRELGAVSRAGGSGGCGAQVSPAQR